MFASIRRAFRARDLDDFIEHKASLGKGKCKNTYSSKENYRFAAEVHFDTDTGCITELRVSEDNVDRDLETQMVYRAAQEMQPGWRLGTISCVWLKVGVQWTNAGLYGIGTSGSVGNGVDDSWPMQQTMEALKNKVSYSVAPTLDAMCKDSNVLPPWV